MSDKFYYIVQDNYARESALFANFNICFLSIENTDA